MVLASAGLARGQVSPANEGKTAEQVYKNIKVLQGTPANELNQSMHLMKGATGMDCLYCHIEREWEKDVKPPKEVARAMITMMMDINSEELRRAAGRDVQHLPQRPADSRGDAVFPVVEPKEVVEAHAADRRSDPREVRASARRRGGNP